LYAPNVGDSQEREVGLEPTVFSFDGKCLFRVFVSLICRGQSLVRVAKAVITNLTTPAKSGRDRIRTDCFWKATLFVRFSCRGQFLVQVEEAINFSPVFRAFRPCVSSSVRVEGAVPTGTYGQQGARHSSPGQTSEEFVSSHLCGTELSGGGWNRTNYFSFSD